MKENMLDIKLQKIPPHHNPNLFNLLYIQYPLLKDVPAAELSLSSQLHCSSLSSPQLHCSALLCYTKKRTQFNKHKDAKFIQIAIF